jgi:hypothetical protein
MADNGNGNGERQLARLVVYGLVATAFCSLATIVLALCLHEPVPTGITAAIVGSVAGLAGLGNPLVRGWSGRLNGKGQGNGGESESGKPPAP